MNREIKFRVWLDDKMIYPKSDFDSGVDMLISIKGQHYVNGVYKDVILQQYTGLKDKNEKEIYEGDIVFNDMSEHSHIVSWDDILFSFTITDMKSNTWLYLNEIIEDINCYDIIGNIYENPELLEDEI